MLSWRKYKWLKVVAMALVFAFMSAQTSFAGRGRRGGNSDAELVVAAIGGAAMPLTAAFAGANATYAMLVGSATSLALTKSGVDPQVASLISAAASGATSGGLSMAPGQVNPGIVMTKAIVKRVIAAEVSYELRRAGWGPWAGLAASGAAMATEGAFSLGFGEEQEFREGVAGGQNLPEDFSTFSKNLPARLGNILVREGISGLIETGIQSAVGERSLSLMYAGNISSLGDAIVGERLYERALKGTKKYEVVDVVKLGEWQFTGITTEDAEEMQTKEGGSIFEGPGDKTAYIIRDREVLKVVRHRKDERGCWEYMTYRADSPFSAKEFEWVKKEGLKLKPTIDKDRRGEIRLLAEVEDTYRPGPHFVWDKPDDIYLWQEPPQYKEGIDGQLYYRFKDSQTVPVAPRDEESRMFRTTEIPKSKYDFRRGQIDLGRETAVIERLSEPIQSGANPIR